MKITLVWQCQLSCHQLHYHNHLKRAILVTVHIHKYSMQEFWAFLKRANTYNVQILSWKLLPTALIFSVNWFWFLKFLIIKIPSFHFTISWHRQSHESWWERKLPFYFFGKEPKQEKLYHESILQIGVMMKAVQAALFTLHPFLLYQGCKSLFLLQSSRHCPTS